MLWEMARTPPRRCLVVKARMEHMCRGAVNGLNGTKARTCVTVQNLFCTSVHGDTYAQARITPTHKKINTEQWCSLMISITLLRAQALFRFKLLLFLDNMHWSRVGLEISRLKQIACVCVCTSLLPCVHARVSLKLLAVNHRCEDISALWGPFSQLSGVCFVTVLLPSLFSWWENNHHAGTVDVHARTWRTANSRHQLEMRTKTEAVHMPQNIFGTGLGVINRRVAPHWLLLVHFSLCLFGEGKSSRYTWPALDIVLEQGPRHRRGIIFFDIIKYKRKKIANTRIIALMEFTGHILN